MKRYFLIPVIVLTFLLLFSGCVVRTTTQPQRRERRPSSPNSKAKYMQDAQPLIQEAGTVLEDISKISKDVSEKKITPKEGAKQLREKKQELDNIKRDFEAITPPNSMKKFHTYIVKALNLYSEGTGKAADGLDTNNTTLINQAAELFNQGNKEVQKAHDELQKNQKMDMHGREKNKLDRLEDSLKDIPEM